MTARTTLKPFLNKIDAEHARPQSAYKTTIVRHHLIPVRERVKVVSRIWNRSSAGNYGASRREGGALSHMSPPFVLCDRCKTLCVPISPPVPRSSVYEELRGRSMRTL